MHQSAKAAGKAFFQSYELTGKVELSVLDIGSMDVNGSLRTVIPTGAKYLGMDVVPGPGVDLVLDDPCQFPLDSDSVDVVISSSCFEHDPFFWLTFLEVSRVLKKGGLFYLNVPSNGFYHRYPSDYWRFYPDAGKSLEAWALRNGMVMQLMESFILPQFEGELWNDFVAVFCKGDRTAQLPQTPLHRLFSKVTNIWIRDKVYPINENKLPEDRCRLAEAEYGMKRMMGRLEQASMSDQLSPTCNLCGGKEFGSGPNGRMSDSEMAPCCRKCGSLERQRILRRVFQALPIGFLDWRRGLQFSPDTSIDARRFRNYEVSVYGGENSLDIQKINRKDDSYDFVTLNHVLEFIPDDRKAFNELVRVLSPRGILQICFSAPMSREISQDFDIPFGPHEAWHLYGRDLAKRFDCNALGLTVLAIEEADPCTGTREIVHLFLKAPSDAMRIRGWLSAWSSTACVQP